MKKFVSRETLEKTKEILRHGNVCDNCLGRQFAQISTGMTNRERGKIVRKALGKPPGKPKTKKKCIVCEGFFQNIDDYARKAIKALRGIEFESFVVGTIMSSELIRNEESLWEDVGIEYCETFKAESNRELGKILERRTKANVDEKNPNVNVILNLEKNRIELQINPLFISGKYKKLVRGIPQTKWEKYKETVEDIIAKPFMRESQGSGHTMHAAGREDIDARCLDWRPFVFEILNPRRRELNLEKIKREVNKSRKVEVKNLGYSDRKGVVRIKSLQPDKTYRVIVSFEKPIKGVERIRKILGKIMQKTPKRVLHRRADKTRTRMVKDISWKRIINKKLEIVIKGEAGLYIKELITGDDGRTKPSLAEVLKNPARVEELDVIKIHLKGRSHESE